MRSFCKVLLLVVLLSLLAFVTLAATTYVDNAGLGSPVVQPQVVAAVPTEPYACVAAQRGRLIYVDDTNSGAEAYLCFCGTDADDSTYIWLKVEAPASNCF